MTYQEIKGNIITLAQEGNFDVIAHGCNCFCTMGAGLAPQMAKAFGCDKFEMEKSYYSGDINKLGTIEYEEVHLNIETGEIVDIYGGQPYFDLYVVNAYTQFGFGKNHANGTEQPVDYDAIKLCMRKMNHIFRGQHIGLPQIGCGLAGGDWEVVKTIIQTELKDCNVTVVIYEPIEEAIDNIFE